MNTTYETLAALVLRVGGQAAGGQRPLSWTELGEVFNVTKDVARHRVTRFKQKYNIVDTEVVIGFNRDFLADNTPEEEKNALAGNVVLPGDITESGVVISGVNIGNMKVVKINANDKPVSMTVATPLGATKVEVAKTVEPVAHDDTENRVHKIVREQLGLYDQVNNDQRFVDDLGADSLDLVELVMALEDEFEKEISDEEAESVTTVQEAIDLIRKKLGYAVVEVAPVIKETIVVPVATDVVARSEIKNTVAQREMEPLQSLITPGVIVVVRDGQPLTIDKTHKNFDKIKVSLETKAWQDALDFIDMKNTLTRYSNGRVTVEGGAVTLDGEKVPGKVASRLIHCLTSENLEALEGISNFLAKCDENPDHRVVTRIYDFISHNDLRLDKDGFILAYKVVKSNYFDKYTGTMDNSPGKIVSMKRNKVNPRDNETCSFGLHVAAKKYIPSYGSVGGGDRVLLCKVNPKDFVSIPTDYNSMKARVCEYLVLKDVTENFKENVGIEA